MKYVLGIVLVLTLSTMVWAQRGEGSEHCTFQAQVQDNSCDGNCPTSSTFSPACDGTHTFRIEARCQGLHDSEIYRVTAYLYEVGVSEPIATLQNWDQEGCGDSTSTSVELEMAHGYQIKVCLEACYQHQCRDCASAGYAEAKVYHL